MGQLTQKTYTDPRFRSRGDAGRALYVFFVAQEERVPGLIRGGPPSWAHEAGRPAAFFDAGLRELVEVDLARYDSESMIAQVPAKPIYNRAGNPNVLRGWYRHWCKLPRVAIRSRHVAAIERSVWFEEDGQRRRFKPASAQAWVDVWAETFGSESPSFTTVTTQTELFAPPVTKGSESLSQGFSESSVLGESFGREHTHLNPFERNEISVCVRESDPKERERGVGREANASEADVLLAQYLALFAERYGTTPEPVPGRLADWAAGRVEAAGLAECLERLTRLYAETPPWLSGVLTFRTFERNFDKLAKSPTPSNGHAKVRDLHRGPYEPNPATKFRSGRVKI